MAEKFNPSSDTGKDQLLKGNELLELGESRKKFLKQLTTLGVATAIAPSTLKVFGKEKDQSINGDESKNESLEKMDGLEDIIPSGAPEVFDNESTELYKREIMRDHVLKQRDGGNWSFIAVEVNGQRKILAVTAAHVDASGPGDAIYPNGDFFGFQTNGGRVGLDGVMRTSDIGPTLPDPTTMKFKMAEITGFRLIEDELENPGANDWKTIRTFPIEQNTITPEDAGYIMDATQSGNWAIGPDPIPGYDPDLAERFVAPVNMDPSGTQDSRTRIEFYNDGVSVKVPTEVFNPDVPNVGIYSSGGEFGRFISEGITPEMMSDKQLGLEDSKKIVENYRVLGSHQNGSHPNDNDGVLRTGVSLIYPYIQEIKEQLATQYGVNPEDIVFCTEAYDMRVNGVGDVETIGRVVDHITSVEEIDAPIPEGYKLEQNYPNPFNPTTRIRFAIPQSEKVTLKVYDVLGREVATLIDGEYMSAGTYEKIFNAKGIASGTYIYKISAGNYSNQNKLVLLK